MTLLSAPYQRHRERLHDALVAAFLALLVGRFLAVAGVAGPEWRLILMVALAVAAFYSRGAGYLGALALVAWPLWLLSPWLALLAGAVALLVRPWAEPRLPWLLLIGAAPLLANGYVLALIPFLGALLGGVRKGTLAGALAVPWLAVVAGLTGRSGPLVALLGPPYSVAVADARLADVGPLALVGLLVEPLTRGGGPLFLLLLQALGWGAAAWALLWVCRREWEGPAPRYPMILALAAGSLVLWATLYLLPALFRAQPLGAFLADSTPASGIALSALAAGVVAHALHLVAGAAAQKPARRDRIAVPPRALVAPGRGRDEGEMLSLDID